MNNYTEYLKTKFEDLEINLIKHDTSPTGCPCYVEVILPKPVKDKDKGTTALDLGNYLFRVLNLSFQNPPEYNRIGKTETIRFYMTWGDVKPIQANICQALDSKVLAEDWLPFKFSSLIIQNKAKGVRCG